MAGQFFCDEEVKISLCSEVLTTNTQYSMFNTTLIPLLPMGGEEEDEFVWD